ncbi:MAG: tetratricopeptide repeat protein [Calditrichaeota bacterium]|nr:tetratricopeptide repeat protein [Calditrichota bacterium]
MKFLLSIFALSLMLSNLTVAQQIIVQPGSPGQIKQPQRSPAQIQAERARREEQRGNYKGALAAWQEALKMSPNDPGALTGIPNCFVQLRDFDSAESFLQDQITKSQFRGSTPWQDPASTFQLTLALGEVKLAREDEDSAWKIWDEALATQQANPDARRSLVSILQRNRRWEESEKLIRDYRKESKIPAFMAIELASSLQAQMNFAAAAEELLLNAKTSPTAWQISLSYLSRFPEDSTVEKSVMSILEQAIKRDKKESSLWRMYAGYALKSGRLETSLDATIAADSLSDSGGTLVLSSAQQLLSEGEAELARRGFTKVLSWKPEEAIAERAELGLAQCLETQGNYSEAKSAYERFLSGRPKSNELEEARFRIAEIMLTHEQRPADALTEYTGIYQRARGPLKSKAGMRIGDAHAYLGEYSAAIDAWQPMAVPIRGQWTEEAADAQLRIARANMWRDSTEFADKALEAITAGSPQNLSFNDAVLYQALLSSGGFHGALRAFADADYASFRADYAMAAQKYGEAASLLKYGRLAEWSRISEAEALRSSNQPENALAALDTFVVSFPESVDLPRAKYLQAVITLEDLQQESKALEMFQSYLIEYPRSLYLEQARRKARVLANKIS